MFVCFFHTLLIHSCKGHEVSHSAPSGALLKEWSFNSSSTTCLHGMETNTFTFTFLLLRIYAIIFYPY